MNSSALKHLTFGLVAALSWSAAQSDVQAQEPGLTWKLDCRDANQPNTAVLIGLKGTQNYFFSANGNNQIYGKLNPISFGSGVLFTVENAPLFYGLVVDTHSLKLFSGMPAVGSNQPFWNGTCTSI